MSESEEEVRKALEDVLTMYDIKLEEEPESEEDAKQERFGDYSEIINKTQKRLDELNEKAEEIYQRTGMNREQLEAYASNPNNFSKEQWEALQKVKDACEKYKREARARIGEEQFEKRAEKPRKKQPGRFAKKKHWIPL
ncbi:MAG: hypothetical protein JJU12_03900 [Chlamydiales bacterium]|nr:hypothetical protein [Chlamydiales bacterium]